jgi:TolB-like protein/Tfp pilus assembly protein PilF
VDGMTDAITAELGQISSLRVISSTSARSYRGSAKPLPEIARELDVDAVIEGAVLRDGQRVRIIAELVHAASDRHLWSRSYERDLDDVITLQREVAAHVATEVRAKLTAQERTRLATPRPVNKEAYEAYLRGRHFYAESTEESLRKAQESFERALAADPDMAAAHAGLAAVHLSNAEIGGHFDGYAKAKAAARKAVDMDPGLAEAHTALGFATFLFDRDWVAAERSLRRGTELNPSSADAHEDYAWYLAARSRLEEALTEMKRAQELDPLSPLTNAAVAGILFAKREPELGVSVLQKTLELKPDFVVAQYGLGRLYLLQGKNEQAIAQFKKALSLTGNSPGMVADLAHAYAVTGNKREALKTLARWEQLARTGYPRTEQAAHVYAALGDKKKALALLETAFQNRSLGLLWIKVDPRFDSLREEPAFKDLVTRIQS